MQVNQVGDPVREAIMAFVYQVEKSMKRLTLPIYHGILEEGGLRAQIWPSSF